MIIASKCNHVEMCLIQHKRNPFPISPRPTTAGTVRYGARVNDDEEEIQHKKYQERFANE